MRGIAQESIKYTFCDAKVNLQAAESQKCRMASGGSLNQTKQHWRISSTMGGAGNTGITMVFTFPRYAQ
jgi:hypothetical protein